MVPGCKKTIRVFSRLLGGDEGVDPLDNYSLMGMVLSKDGRRRTYQHFLVRKPCIVVFSRVVFVLQSFFELPD